MVRITGVPFLAQKVKG